MTSPIPEIERFFSSIRIADVLDIVVIGVLLYLVARWLLHRASWAVAIGLTLILALNLAAQLFSMYLTLAVFRAGAVLIVVILAIVFQDDIRRGIEWLAAWRPGRRQQVRRPMQDVKELLVEAVAEMAERRMGALIVLAGRQPLEAHIRGGIPLHGEPSFPLFLSIFHDQTPGHDGAVILEGSVVTRFGAHLPLSRNLEELGNRGTRHAAALGLSEWCDAMVVVVSEETGAVSIAEDGALTNLGSAAQLSDRLDVFYSRQEQGTSSTSAADRAADWSLKGAAVMAACLLWVMFAYRVDRVERVVESVPVEYRNLPAGWRVEQIEPPAVQLTLRGPERAFDRLERMSLRVSLNLGDYAVKRGKQEVEVPPGAINLPRGVHLAPGDPPAIKLTLERILRIDATVQPRLVGSPPSSHQVTQVTVLPEKLPIDVPMRYAGRAQTLETEPIPLEGMNQSFTREVKLPLPPGTAPVGKRTNVVKVRVEIEPIDRAGDHETLGRRAPERRSAPAS